MNYNLAKNNNYKLEITNAPELNFFIQSCTLPTVSMSGKESSIRHHQANAPGNYVVYSEFNCVILMDEDFQNYIYLHNWLRDFIDMDDYRNLIRNINLHILSANKQNIIVFEFFGAFPTNLASISFDSAITDSQIITFDVEFTYQYFTFKNILPK